MSSQQEQLLKTIYELEAENDLLIENDGLLRFKISTLEIWCYNDDIDKLNKKQETNMKTDNRAGKSNTVNIRIRSEIHQLKTWKSSVLQKNWKKSSKFPVETLHNGTMRATYIQVPSHLT